MNYLKTGKLIFDLGNCLENVFLSSEDKVKIYDLYDKYRKREILNKEKADDYFNLAGKFTKTILSA